MLIAYEQQTIIAEQEFLGENGLPLELRDGYPKARLMMNGDLISILNPEPLQNGRYSVLVVVPEFGFNEPTPIDLKWRAHDKEGNLIKIDSVIMVQPSSKPHVGDIVLMEDEEDILLTLPIRVPEGRDVNFAFYLNNDLIIKGQLDTPDVTRYATYSDVKLKHKLEAIFTPYLLTIDFRSFDNRIERMMQNVWIVTPQMLNAVNLLEGFLNKAKIDNTIPQLDYTQADLLTYLQRGLGLFNMYKPNLTSFNGRNMQGGLLNVLVLCGSYYALGSQLLAEGSLAFDFSGQAVTLNVDRTPALESALGRVEQQLEATIPNMKQMLLRRGVTGGEGSDTVGNSSGLGHTVLSNSPTTSRHVWRPGFQNYYR